MQIQTVKVENIRSYISEVIDFSQGSTLLSGDIGCGKSTILLAIEFALFGLKKGELSGGALLRKGCSEGGVELKFRIEEAEYLIRRTLKKTSNGVAQGSGYILEDGLKTEMTPVELKSKIISLLGYPEELVSKSASMIYRFTVYTPQEQMKQILFENPDERLNTLRKVFDVDKYKRINENVGIYVKKLKDENKELFGFVLDLDEKKRQFIEKNKEIESKETELLKVINELREAGEEKNTFNEKIKKFELEIEGLNQIKKKVEITNSNIEKDQKRLEELKTENQQLQQEITDLKQKHKEIETVSYEISFEALKKEIEGLEKEKDKLLQEKNDYEKNLKTDEANLENISESIKQSSEKIKSCNEKKAQLNNLQNQIKLLEGIEGREKEVTEEISNLNKQINLCEHKVKVSLERIRKIESIDQCPTCFQEVDMHHKTKIQHDSDNEKANQEKQIKELNTILSSKKESLDKVNSTIKEYRELKQRLATLKGEISNFDSLSEEVKVLLKKKEELITILKNKQSGKEWNFGEIEVQLKEKKNLSEQIQANELKIKEKDNLNNLLKDKETRLNKNQLEFETVNKAIVELKINKGLYEEKLEKNSKLLEEFALVKEQFDKILDKEKIIFGKKSGIEKEIQTVKQITELLQKDIDKKEVAKKNLEQKSQLINWLQEYFVNLLNTIEKQVMIKIQRQFNDLFVEWFSLMIENMDAELDETFTPKVQQNEHDIEIESLSGGEKTALALAYRLALNKVINDLVANIKTKNLIILDEPTDGFSTEQLDRVRDVLERLGLKQMVLVSHENKVESFVDKVLNIQKEGHISKVA